VCVSEDLRIQITMRMRYIAICGLSVSTIYFQIISYKARFWKERYET